LEPKLLQNPKTHPTIISSTGLYYHHHAQQQEESNHPSHFQHLLVPTRLHSECTCMPPPSPHSSPVRPKQYNLRLILFRPSSSPPNNDYVQHPPSRHHGSPPTPRGIHTQTNQHTLPLSGCRQDDGSPSQQSTSKRIS
jgi:hypothetical protein